MQGFRLYWRISDGYGCNLLHLGHRGEDCLPRFSVAPAKRETTADLFSHLGEGTGYVVYFRFSGAPWPLRLCCIWVRHACIIRSVT
jgi:hypothetical protein